MAAAARRAGTAETWICLGSFRPVRLLVHRRSASSCSAGAGTPRRRLVRNLDRAGGHLSPPRQKPRPARTEGVRLDLRATPKRSASRHSATPQALEGRQNSWGRPSNGTARDYAPGWFTASRAACAAHSTADGARAYPVGFYSCYPMTLGEAPLDDCWSRATRLLALATSSWRTGTSSIVRAASRDTSSFTIASMRSSAITGFESAVGVAIFATAFC